MSATSLSCRCAAILSKGGVLEEDCHVLAVEGADSAVDLENGDEAFEDLGVEVMLVQELLH